MQPVARLGVGIGYLHRDQARLQAGRFEPAGLFLSLGMNRMNTNMEE